MPTDTYYNLAIMLAFQAPVICLILCIHVFFSLRRNGLTRTQFILLRALTAGCAGLMVFEVLNGLTYYGVLDLSYNAAVITMTCSYGMMLFNSIMLTEFCLSKVGAEKSTLCKLFRVLYAVIAVLLVLRIALPQSELFFYYEGDILKYGPLDDLQTWGCAVINLLCALMMFGKCRDKREYVNREGNLKLLFASGAMALIFLVYVIFFIPYIIWIGFMLVLLTLFTGLQGLMIDRDELTSLNNRRRLLKDIGANNREKLAWSCILADVNKFKQVNDTFGHNEGDRALTIAADVLRDVSRSHDAEAYRLGGDEFAVLVNSEDKNTLDRLCAAITMQLAKRTANEKLPYALTLSLGYAIYGEDGVKDIPAIMQRADERMYANKHGKENASCTN